MMQNSVPAWRSGGPSASMSTSMSYSSASTSCAARAAQSRTHVPAWHAQSATRVQLERARLASGHTEGARLASGLLGGRVPGWLGGRVQRRCASGAPGGTARGRPRSARASSSDKETDFVPLVHQERFYLLKLLVACTAGGAVVKYGSLLVPQATQPDATAATVMVFTPVVVSLLLLAFLSQQQGSKK